MSYLSTAGARARPPRPSLDFDDDATGAQREEYKYVLWRRHTAGTRGPLQSDSNSGKGQVSRSHDSSAESGGAVSHGLPTWSRYGYPTRLGQLYPTLDTSPHLRNYLEGLVGESPSVTLDQDEPKGISPGSLDREDSKNTGRRASTNSVVPILPPPAGPRPKGPLHTSAVHKDNATDTTLLSNASSTTTPTSSHDVMAEHKIAQLTMRANSHPSTADHMSESETLKRSREEASRLAQPEYYPAHLDLGDLPTEVFWKICTYCDVPTLLALSATCRMCYLAMGEQFWQFYFLTHWAPLFGNRIDFTTRVSRTVPRLCHSFCGTGSSLIDFVEFGFTPPTVTTLTPLKRVTSTSSNRPVCSNCYLPCDDDANAESRVCTCHTCIQGTSSPCKLCTRTADPHACHTCTCSEKCSLGTMLRSVKLVLFQINPGSLITASTFTQSSLSTDSMEAANMDHEERQRSAASPESFSNRYSGLNYTFYSQPSSRRKLQKQKKSGKGSTAIRGGPLLINVISACIESCHFVATQLGCRDVSQEQDVDCKGKGATEDGYVDGEDTATSESESNSSSDADFNSDDDDDDDDDDHTEVANASDRLEASAAMTENLEIARSSYQYGEHAIRNAACTHGLVRLISESKTEASTVKSVPGPTAEIASVSRQHLITTAIDVIKDEPRMNKPSPGTSYEESDATHSSIQSSLQSDVPTDGSSHISRRRRSGVYSRETADGALQQFVAGVPATCPSVPMATQCESKPASLSTGGSARNYLRKNATKRLVLRSAHAKRWQHACIIQSKHQAVKDVLVASACRTSPAMMQTKSRPASSTSSTNSKRPARSMLELRQCVLCNKLDVYSTSAQHRELQLASSEHGSSIWIRPCKCGTFMHRVCLEAREMRMGPNAPKACEICGSNFKPAFRLPLSLAELLRVTWKDRHRAVRYLVLRSLPLFLLCVLLAMFTAGLPAYIHTLSAFPSSVANHALNATCGWIYGPNANRTSGQSWLYSIACRPAHHDTAIQPAQQVSPNDACLAFLDYPRWANQQGAVFMSRIIPSLGNMPREHSEAALQFAGFEFPRPLWSELAFFLTYHQMLMIYTSNRLQVAISKVWFSPFRTTFLYMFLYFFLSSSYAYISLTRSHVMIHFLGCLVVPWPFNRFVKSLASWQESLYMLHRESWSWWALSIMNLFFYNVAALIVLYIYWRTHYRVRTLQHVEFEPESHVLPSFGCLTCSLGMCLDNHGGVLPAHLGPQANDRIHPLQVPR